MNNPSSKPLAERFGTATVGIRKELEISRHVFRDQVSYIVHDPVAFRSHQVSARNYQIFAALDTELQLKDVFRKLVKRNLLAQDQEQEFYDFIVYLNRLGLLQLPVSDGSSLYDRLKAKKAARDRWSVEKLLFFRMPLLQPDAFLGRTVHIFRPLFTRTAFIVWLVAFCLCGTLLFSRWSDFRDPLGSMITLRNAPMLLCLLIGLKILHEFGHAYACKSFGGRVPEMGAFFMVLTPCAYVDATSAWSFPNRIHRIVVSLAGVYFESIIAMIALVIFFSSETSQLREAAHYTVVLSTIVTLGFNINPLMRYDGYYVLADSLNIPNLRVQSNQQFVLFAKRMLFGLRLPNVVNDRVGAVGLGVFGAFSTLYRWLIIFGIVSLLAYRIPGLGIVLAICFSVSFLARQSRSLWRYLRTSTELSGRRARACIAVTGLAISMFLLLTVVPISHTTHAFGIVEGSQDRIVRAESNGFLVESRFGEGDRIVKRQLLARLENPEIDSLVLQHDSVTRAMETELFDRIKNRDPSEAANAQQRLKSSRQQLEQYKRSQNGLDVRAPVTGRIVDSTVLKETGKFLRKGDFVTRVSAGATVLRVTMTEQDYSDTHPVVGDEVILRFAATDGFSMIGRIQSVGRSGSNEIDEPRLTQLAGGDIPVDPNTMRAKSSYFELKIVPVGPVPDQVRHGMSGVAELNGDHRSLGIDLYRLALRFIHKLRMES